MKSNLMSYLENGSEVIVTPQKPLPVTGQAAEQSSSPVTSAFRWVADGTNYLQVTKSAPGTLYRVTVINEHTVPVYVHLFDSSNSPNVAVDAPFWSVMAQGIRDDQPGETIHGFAGLGCDNGIAFSCVPSMASTNTTPVPAGKVTVNVEKI